MYVSERLGVYRSDVRGGFPDRKNDNSLAGASAVVIMLHLIIGRSILLDLKVGLTCSRYLSIPNAMHISNTSRLDYGIRGGSRIFG